MISRLAHLCLRTDRFQEMISFYRDVLGLHIQFGLQNEEGVTFCYYFDLGNHTFIEIFDHKLSAKHWNLAGDEIHRPPVTHYSHFCLETSDIKRLREEFLAKGLNPTEISTGMDKSDQMWIKDPDGNSIELMEYNSNSFQLRNF